MKSDGELFYGLLIKKHPNDNWGWESLLLFHTRFTNLPFSLASKNEELDRKPGIAANLGNIGNAYMMQRDYPQALENFFKAVKSNET